MWSFLSAIRPLSIPILPNTLAARGLEELFFHLERFLQPMRSDCFCPHLGVIFLLPPQNNTTKYYIRNIARFKACRRQCHRQ
jgi:hypothetical protein